MRFTAKRRNHPSVKRCENSRVSNTRAVRRKGRAHLVQAIVCTLNGLAVGQKLDVDLAPAEKSVRTPNEGEHAAIRRDRGRCRRIREVGHCNETCRSCVGMPAAQKQSRGCDNHNCGGYRGGPKGARRKTGKEY